MSFDRITIKYFMYLMPKKEAGYPCIFQMLMKEVEKELIVLPRHQAEIPGRGG